MMLTPWYIHFLVGAFAGAFLVGWTIPLFISSALKTVRCLAEQNVELVRELKQRESWEDEGESWKLSKLEEDDASED